MTTPSARLYDEESPFWICPKWRHEDERMKTPSARIVRRGACRPTGEHHNEDERMTTPSARLYDEEPAEDERMTTPSARLYDEEPAVRQENIYTGPTQDILEDLLENYSMDLRPGIGDSIDKIQCTRQLSFRLYRQRSIDEVAVTVSTSLFNNFFALVGRQGHALTSLFTGGERCNSALHRDMTMVGYSVAKRQAGVPKLQHADVRSDETLRNDPSKNKEAY
ncbi:hypothetical protein Bbelb_094240 [Branchiostoma belcheri]|nr:hypothetical protein Bbelb_094240 [Branchiostoma belcheri]